MRGYPSSLVPGLWFQVISWGRVVPLGSAPKFLLGEGRGGEEGPLHSRQDQGRGTISPEQDQKKDIPFPSRAKTGVPQSRTHHARDTVWGLLHFHAGELSCSVLKLFFKFVKLLAASKYEYVIHLVISTGVLTFFNLVPF